MTESVHDGVHDDLYDVLAHPQRRQLLFGLLADAPQTDSPIDLDAPPDGVISSEAERLEHEHVHLPKLDDYGFVEWMPSINCVEPGPRFDEVRPVLELLAGYHDERQPCY